MGAEKGSEDSWGGGPAPATSVDVGRLQPSPRPRARVSPGLLDSGDGDTQALQDEGPAPAADAAGGALRQAGDAFLPGHGSLSSIQPFTCLGEAHPLRRQGVMGAGEEALLHENPN
ncbi:unnamed protein product [Rangifer tarandus platyrhynchus]|uniref:Uncharacterized protein n=2 Tax=Rangifer tarandus platyrhynchus TaxID=3082113 RepID=A0ACB0DZW5_RANTA|nr:unnamed protein product [Rangifer tarandus platyrhynchus]CAI9693694.1 unnamed protein product [Rangifer tarandus platyrhynchus]